MSASTLGKHLSHSSSMSKAAPEADKSGIALPSGTVTFLLTDIEGSTRLWEADEAMAAGAVARHYELLDAGIALNGGLRPQEQGEGDSVVGVFQRASDAAQAALDVQRAFAAEAWPAGHEVRVRVALHSGEATLRDERNYFGPTVVQAARIRDAGHGGQILLSSSTRELLAGHEPDGASLVDLGTHRLKDLGRPERIWLLRHPDLPGDFPPLRSLDLVPNNLPVALTSFVGRDVEVAELHAALADRRLITVSGSGGCGKTRLAARVAAEVAENYPDGTWWVELGPVSDSAMVAYAAARSLGFHEEEGRPILDTLAEQLAGLSMLVVFDNCEHVLDAAAVLAETLLRAAPGLRLLATSREALGVPGEFVWRVPSLDLAAAVELFIERARFARGQFDPDAAAEAAVGEVCRRLDGIPLAIELAAARARMMSPARIAEGLDDRFRLLTGSGRASMPRQQTLETSVAWSYELLDDSERALLRRLSVFAGGFALPGAEAVCGDDPLEPYQVLDLLGRLIDKSLVQTDAAGTDRYRLLETIRMYARDRLAEAGEADAVRDRHVAHYVALAEEAEPELARADGPRWLGALDQDFDNLRAAMEWGEHRRKADELLGLVGALTLFFEMRGHIREGGRWFARALALEAEPSALRARALWGAGHLASYASDFLTAAQRAPEALALAEAVGDDRVRARALNTRGFLQMWFEPAEGRETFSISVELGAATGDDWAVADGLKMTTVAWMLQDDYNGQKASLDDLSRVAAELENLFFSAWAHCCRGWAAVRRGDVELARRELASSLEECNQVGEPATAGIALALLGELAAWTGDDEEVVAGIDAFLGRAAATGGAIAVPWAVSARAMLAMAAGQPGQAREILAPLIEEMRSFGIPSFLATALVFDGIAAAAVGDVATAEAELNAARDQATKIDNRWLTALADHHLGVLARRAGQPNRAQDLLHAALSARITNGWLPGVALTLIELANVAADQESWEESIRLAAAASTLRAALQGSVAVEAEIVARLNQAVRQDIFDHAWAEGAVLSGTDAVAYASRARGERSRPSSGWPSLTPTETAVVDLVAKGLTNPQIAEQLFIARGTVKAHLAHIFTKLGVTTRAELAAQATRRASQPT